MPRARARAACASSRACWSPASRLTDRRIKRVLDRPGRRSPARSWSMPPASGRATSARMAGVRVPAGAVEHQYLITEKSNAIPPGLPTLRDPDQHLLSQARARGAGDRRLGEGHAAPSAPTACPSRSAASCCSPTTTGCEQFVLPAAERLPMLNELGIRTVINGPIPISPDGEPIMGLAPELDNFYVACGFTSGIAASGGAGKAMAEWIVEGEPGLDLWAFDVRRFGSHHMSASATSPSAASTATGATTRSTSRSRSCESARGGRRSPLYPAAQGQERRVRLALRLGAAQLVRAGRHRGDRQSRPSRAGPTGSARSATNAAPRASAPC